MKRRDVLIGGGAALGVSGMAIGGSFASMGSMDEYTRAMAALRAPLGAGADMAELVRFATLAANSHNTQPWRFTREDKSVRISPDVTRRTPAVDPDDHHMFVSLGCASENLMLAAASRGLVGETRFDPEGTGAVVFDYTQGAEQASALCDAIPRRQSARVEYDGRAVSTADLATLESATQTPSVSLTLITDRAQINRVRDLILAGNTAQMADKAFMAELKDWMRFNPNAALARGDGLFSASSGNPTLPTWIGRPMFDLAFKAEAENEKYARHLASSAGLAVFVGEAATHENWVRVGQACQRFALQATALGLKLAFVNQPVEVASLRPDLAALLGKPGQRPDIVMRFGYGPDVPMSPRRPVAAVMDA
ncbi:MAG: nitroreductase family protein [Pseudomonadota bacterium]